MISMEAMREWVGVENVIKADAERPSDGVVSSTEVVAVGSVGTSSSESEEELA